MNQAVLILEISISQSMKIAVIVLSLTESFNLTGEYEARTRYVQRNAKRTCSQSQLAIPFAQACPGEQIEHGESCQVTCNPGFDQVEEGNLVNIISKLFYKDICFL